jgi:arylsulfatase A-like enzyme
MRLISSFVVLWVVSALGPVVAGADKPNVIVILADDFGYGSVACYGGTGLNTPNLDRLAREGRKFTHAYAPGSVCSPSRYALLTGRYYWRTSVKDGEVLGGTAPLHIETSRMTLASLCKSQGYRTAVVGKWHLGLGSEAKTDWNNPLEPGPLEIGFGYFFGMGSNPWTGPHSFIENQEVTNRKPGEQVVVNAGGKQQNTTTGITKPFEYNQIMKVMTEKAVAWVDQNHQAPFFLYFAPNAVHRPVDPNPKFTGSRFGIYGDFIHELDWSVGELLAAVDRHKLADNTLVVFASDNGGVVNPNNAEAQIAIKAGLAINGPLRGGKHDVWEGGFRTPFLVRWPAKVPAGTTSEQVVCHTDMLATLAGILDVPLPKDAGEDSFDAGPAFFDSKSGDGARDHVILQSANAEYGIRMGNWKLVEREGAPDVEPRRRARQAGASPGERPAGQKAAKAKRKAAPDHDELFDLAADPAEAKDVHAEHPEVVAKLRKALAEARDRGRTR